MLSVALVLTACQQAERYEPAEVTWVGEHIEFAPGPNTQVCAGSLTFMDEFTGLLSQQMGGSSEHVRYFHLDYPELAQVPGCGDSLARCAGEGWVYSSYGVDRHELVHAVRQNAFGGHTPGLSFLEEGLADLYNDSQLRLDIYRERLSEIRADVNGILAPELYPTAAHYVSFLVQRYGFSQVLEYINGSGTVANLDELDQRFAAIFGEAPQLAHDAYGNYLECFPFERTRNTFECSLPPQPWTGTGLDRTVDLIVPNLDCSTPGALGPALGFDGDEVWIYMTFDIEQPGNYLLFTPLEFEDEAEGAETTVARCDTDCIDPLFLYNSEAFSNHATLDPGRYVVRMSRPLSDPGFVGMRVRPSPF